MTDVAIQVERLSKRFTIGATRQRDYSLRDQLGESFKRLWRHAPSRSQEDTIWALKEVSFEVKQGELVGLVGPNGAGKSTLLKILSRITQPTAGRAKLFGTVASMLEVGTGFHPELSGRENVYLNGAILGMKKVEIDRKFDEIVAFAEVDRFIDTPVKRYSSGMYVRLGFAVAAHLETDILMVDEVLAVGDFAFQRKCLGTMRAATGQGRTVIVVSHNIGMIQQLCNRCLFIDGGAVRVDGPPEIVVAAYFDRYAGSRALRADGAILSDRGDGIVLRARGSQQHLLVRCGDPLTIDFEVESPEPLEDVAVELRIATSLGAPAVTTSTRVQNVACRPGRSRSWKVRCELGVLPLNPGSYSVSASIGSSAEDVTRFTGAFTIRVAEQDVFGSGQSVPPSSVWGPLHWAPTWTVAPKEGE